MKNERSIISLAYHWGILFDHHFFSLYKLRTISIIVGTWTFLFVLGIQNPTFWLFLVTTLLVSTLNVSTVLLLVSLFSHCFRDSIVVLSVMSLGVQPSLTDVVGELASIDSKHFDNMGTGKPSPVDPGARATPAFIFRGITYTVLQIILVQEIGVRVISWHLRVVARQAQRQWCCECLWNQVENFWSQLLR